MKKKDTFSRLKSRERESRVSLILDAAEKVFESRPFDKVSMQEIADEAGIAKSSIYTYFTNQESLFVEAAIRNVNILIEKLEGSYSAAGEQLDAAGIIDTFIDFFSEHDAFFRMMTTLMASGNISPESVEKLNNIMRMILDLLDRIFFQKIGYSPNHRLLSHSLLAFLNGLLVNYRKLPGHAEVQVLSHMKAVGGVVADILQHYSDNSLTIMHYDKNKK